MSWSERLQTLEQEAKRTAFFGFSAHTQKLYFKLQNAVSRKDAAAAKKLIIKLGF